MTAEPVESFLGLTQTGWSGVAGIASALGAVFAAMSLAFIAWQVKLAREHQVAGIVERGGQNIARSRSELFELNAEVRRLSHFDYGQMRKVRDVFIAYEQYLPIFELATREKGAARSADLDWFVDDIGTLIEILSYLNKQTAKQNNILGADAGKVLDAFLDACQASDDDRKRAHELLDEASSTEEFNSFIDLIKNGALARQGRSAVEIGSGAASRATSEASDEERRELLRTIGGDVTNRELLRDWLAEIGAMITQVKKILDRLKISVAPQ